MDGVAALQGVLNMDGWLSCFDTTVVELTFEGM